MKVLIIGLFVLAVTLSASALYTRDGDSNNESLVDKLDSLLSENTARNKRSPGKKPKGHSKGPGLVNEWELAAMLPFSESALRSHHVVEKEEKRERRGADVVETTGNPDTFEKRNRREVDTEAANSPVRNRRAPQFPKPPGMPPMPPMPMPKNFR